MRVAALLFVVAAAALPVVQAQTVDKTKPAADATVKPSAAAKPAAQGKAVTATESDKSKVEGVATQRSIPADMKKSSDDCQHKGKASDA
jgi:hypothetical protein